MASSNGHIDIVKLLLKHGADFKAIGMSLRHLSSPFHSQLEGRREQQHCTASCIM
jgi:ankyrin repeat protein